MRQSQSNFYYQRRLFLTALYIIAGLVFIGFPIIGLFEPSDKGDLIFFEGKPETLEINYKKESDNQFIRILNIGLKGDTLRLFCDDDILENIKNAIKPVNFSDGDIVATFPSPLGEKNLKKLFINNQQIEKVQISTFYDQYQLIRELSINDKNIVSFEPESKIPYVVLVLLGLLWIVWQIKILLKLKKSKPSDIYKN